MRAFGHVYTFVNTDLLFWRNIFYIAKALDNVRFFGFYTCSRIWFCISLSGKFCFITPLQYCNLSFARVLCCCAVVWLRVSIKWSPFDFVGELHLLSKPSAFPCPHWPRDPPPDQWGRWLEPQQPIRGGCCNASRGHYCSSTAGRRNAAEEGGDVGAGLAEQEHQQVRKYPDSFLLFSDKRFWRLVL